MTRTLNVHGYHSNADRFGALGVYGADAPAIQDLMRATPSLAVPLHAQLPYTGAEVVWAARHEMARTVEDVLARRTRALFLNARAAEAMAPEVCAADGRRAWLGCIAPGRGSDRVLGLAKGYQLPARARRHYFLAFHFAWRHHRLLPTPNEEPIATAAATAPSILIQPSWRDVMQQLAVAAAADVQIGARQRRRPSCSRPIL